MSYKVINIFPLAFLTWAQASFGAANPANPTDPADNFQPYISETLIYDDNFFRLSDKVDSKARTGKSGRWELNNRITAGAKIYLPISRQEFTFEGNVSDNHFANNDQLNYVSTADKGSWKWQAGKSLSGIMSYGYRQYMGGFTNTDFFGKDVITDNTALFNINYRFNPGWRLNGQYQWLDSQHGASERKFLDFASNTGIIGMHYQSPAQNTIGLQYRRTDAQLPNRELVLSTMVDNQYTEQEFSAVYNWRITGKSLLGGRAGYLMRNHRQFSQRDFEGEVWQLNYQWTPTGKTSFALSAWRDLLTGTQDLTASYIVAKGFSISPMWAATSKISLQAKFIWEEREYAGDPGVLAGVKTRVDTILTGQVSASYDFSDHGQLNIVYRKENRESNRLFSDYQYNTVFANAILKF